MKGDPRGHVNSSVTRIGGHNQTCLNVPNGLMVQNRAVKWRS
jgi:hypothetical protein